MQSIDATVSTHVRQSIIFSEYDIKKKLKVEEKMLVDLELHLKRYMHVS